MTALKRQANIAAAYQQPASLTTEPPKRNVVFHLTPYAPGCEQAMPSDAVRRLELFNRRPGQALHALFRRLEIAASAADLSDMPMGSLAIHPVGAPDAPWAFVFSGLTHDEARTALDKLIELESGR